MNSEEVKEALIACLEREDKVLDELSPKSDLAANEAYADDYLNALSDAVMRIAQSSNSQEAWDALVKSGYNADSPFGLTLASRAGNLPALLQAAQSRNPGLRSEAIRVIGEMLKESKAGKVGPIAPEAYLRSKDMLTNSATGGTEDAFVRRAAVDAIGMIADPQDLPLLQRIAVSDPEVVVAENGTRKFPTREEALKSIKLVREGQEVVR